MCLFTCTAPQSWHNKIVQYILSNISTILGRMRNMLQKPAKRKENTHCQEQWNSFNYCFSFQRTFNSWVLLQEQIQNAKMMWVVPFRHTKLTKAMVKTFGSTLSTVQKNLLVINLGSFSFIPHQQTKQHTFTFNNKIQLVGYQELCTWSHICLY